MPVAPRRMMSRSPRLMRLSEFGNGGGLVAGGLVVADDFEPAGGAAYVVGSVVGVNGRHSVSS